MIMITIQLAEAQQGFRCHTCRATYVHTQDPEAKFIVCPHCLQTYQVTQGSSERPPREPLDA
jgi:Zn finger protein HypA/HybF involved in hydrogenase expression